MLRFLPDNWLEGVLRPLVLADPLAGIYFEYSAPDWRFAALALALALVFASRVVQRPPRIANAPFTAAECISLLGLAVTFSVWTAVIGNGRYFIAGLLWVGPALVLVSRRLPGTRAMRWFVLGLVAAVQLFAVVNTHHFNRWGMVRWVDGPALRIGASPLRETPAVFLTLTNISYSLLVPAFHRESSWVNLVGQTDILQGTPESARLQRVLQRNLPVFAVGPHRPSHLDPSGRLSGTRLADVLSALKPHGLTLADESCSLVDSGLSRFDNQAVDDVVKGGFWFCRAVPLPSTPGPAPDSAAAQADRGKRLEAAFSAIERRCPRFFPAGNSVQRTYRDIVTRMYSLSDTKLHIDGADNVLFQHFRAFNPTLVGTVDSVLDDRFALPCDKLPGRYRLPWLRTE